MAATAEMGLERRAYARVGLLGNPSDVYGGRALSFTIADFSATVRLRPSPQLLIQPHPHHDLVAFPSLPQLDFSQEHMDKLGHGIYMPLDVDLLPPLYLIYAENPSDSGKVHSTVRQRWLDGDEFIISRMKEVAQLAFDGHKALLQKDYTELARLMNKNFDLRREMFGDDVLGSVNIKMVEVARSVGASSKFTGSGGTVVALCPDGDSQVEHLHKACEAAGFVVQQVKVAPSMLTDVELSNLLAS